MQLVPVALVHQDKDFLEQLRRKVRRVEVAEAPAVPVGAQQVMQTAAAATVYRLVYQDLYNIMLAVAVVLDILIYLVASGAAALVGI